ncbi:hypothetical protein ZHAS_00001384 [Anopheles sinensis]|uniref:Peptidase S1 domain-containing protein n=1 Tax=Anopheles sinensis TaxID=74873 RepID=A0A084VB97_ANOSI|nr:hypothetical protein ZHAS_00001384 [Anopheles sinensis]
MLCGYLISGDGFQLGTCVFFTSECKEFQNLTALRSYILPLPMYALPIDVTSHSCKKVVQLIAGGEPAENGEFPHHALLGYKKIGTEREYKFECGGTLISDRHVLTAAHCFKSEYPSIVRLAVYDIEKDYGHEVPVEGFLRHPNHSHFNVYHDIALVKLENRVYFTPSIRPACLWDTERSNISKYIATGFGMNEHYEHSKNMMKVVLENYPENDCYERVKFLGSRFALGIQPGQLCAGSNL